MRSCGALPEGRTCATSPFSKKMRTPSSTLMRTMSSKPSAGVKNRASVALRSSQASAVGAGERRDLAVWTPGSTTVTRPAARTSTSMGSPAGTSRARMAWLDRDRHVVDQARAPEARGQPAPERRPVRRAARRGEQVGEDGQRRVARGKRGEGIRRRAAMSLPGKKPPLASQPTIRVSAPAAWRSSSSAATTYGDPILVLRRRTPRSPMRRSTASLALIGTATASARRYSATTMPSRSPDRKRTRLPRASASAAREHGDDERSIGVAVRGDDRVEGAVDFGRQREPFEAVELFVGDVLGVDGNERLAAAGRAHVGAELAQDARQEVAPHGRVLVDEDAQPGEAAAREAADVSGARSPPPPRARSAAGPALA